MGPARIVLASLVLLSVAGCSQSTPATVSMRGAQFRPQEIHIHAGASVRWLNEEELRHTVTPDDARSWGADGTGLLGKSGIWTHEFPAPGLYPYHCVPHSRNDGAKWVGMVGVVNVTA